MTTPGPSVRPPVARVRTATISANAELVKWGNHLASAELQVNDQLYTLSRRRGGGVFHDFQNPIELSSNDRVSLRCKISSFFRKKEIQVQRLDIQSLFASAHNPEKKDLSVTQDGIGISFGCESLGTGPLPATCPSEETLVATTSAVLDDCPRFRILVIGKSGVGKSRLIEAAFGIEKTTSEDLQRGKADISEGLVSPANERFILHDSLGFESGDCGNYDTVKGFIRDRQKVLLKDRIHAVWFCIPLAHTGGRLLEAAAEDFFQSKREIMGTTPLIVVLTKFDVSMAALTLQLAKSGHGNGNCTEAARSQAECLAKQKREEISRLTGERELPFATVSTEANYRDTLHKLIELTDKEVGKMLPPEARVVTRMAQRIDRPLKIEGSIAVGRQRYWKALGTSPHFAGHTIWDCLSVINTDVVNAWNINDPAGHLLGKEFKELVIELVQEMETKPLQDPKKIFVLGAVVSNPFVPIVLPVLAGKLTPVWVYKAYTNVQSVQQIFMAFIVDLTFIMETVFVLTAHNHHKLTRRAIKLAYSTYQASDVKSQAHARIQEYRDVEGRDAALDMIESLILPKDNKSLDVDGYYAEVFKVDKEKLNLDQEEDW